MVSQEHTFAIGESHPRRVCEQLQGRPLATALGHAKGGCASGAHDMRILGIDPGTIAAGYGIVEGDGPRLKVVVYGCIKVNRKDSFPLRLRTIYEGLCGIIERYRPEEAAVEEVFSGKSAKSSIKIGEARGIALLSAACAGLPVSSYPATVVKKSVVGLGSAHKEQVQEMVKIILGLPEVPEPQDAADALAIAICHYHRKSC